MTATLRQATLRQATLRQAAVLVGGLGTRLGALAAQTPKPLLTVGDRPHLAWVLRELCRYGVEEVLLLAGHQAARVHAAVPVLAATLPRPLHLTVLTEPAPAGTGGALHHARTHLHDRFLLLNGDSWFDTTLAALLADAARDPPQTAARLLLRRAEAAGRYGVVALDGDRVTAFAERGEQPGPCCMNAGIMVATAALAARCPPRGSLEGDVLPALAAEGALHGTARDGWFIDIGLPEDFNRAQTELPVRLLGRPALMLDRDGVLNVDHGYVSSRDRLEWVPGAQSAVRMASERGWHVFVATNQSGVARGLYDEQAVQGLHGHMAETLRAAGGTIDDWRYCPHHPRGTVAAYARACTARKPGAGMLRSLVAAWSLDPERCVMLGDQPTDMQAAAAAGIAGVRFDGVDLQATVSALLDSHGARAA